MLCRVADSLFWMSRYIERAENTVRLVDVTLQTLLESEHASEEISFSHWQPVLETLSDLPLYESLKLPKDSYSATHFLTFSKENPSSVFSCIAAARENARMIRDQISSEIWEVINKLYLFLKQQDATKVCQEINFSFFERIKEFTILYQGISESTFPHHLGYEFLMCGKYMERADKTCRILDMKRFMRSIDRHENDSLDSAQWSAILRGCSGLEAYHRTYVADVIESNVKDFLILSRHFPRSVLFCATKLQRAVHAVSQCPTTHFSNEAERHCGMLVSRLSFSSMKDVKRIGEQAFIEDIKQSLADIAQELSSRYMFAEIVDPVAEMSQSQSG